jgi:hypothetical protein
MSIDLGAAADEVFVGRTLPALRPWIAPWEALSVVTDACAIALSAGHVVRECTPSVLAALATTGRRLPALVSHAPAA